MLRRRKRRNHSHLQCSPWSQCWGTSCWCTWWPSPCPFLSAGEDASLGRRTSATEENQHFTEPSIISDQRCFHECLLQRPSSWLWVNHQNRCSPMWNEKAQRVYNLNCNRSHSLFPVCKNESYPTTLFLFFTLGITNVCWAHFWACDAYLADRNRDTRGLTVRENNWNLRRLTALTNFLLALPFYVKKRLGCSFRAADCVSMHIYKQGSVSRPPISHHII